MGHVKMQKYNTIYSVLNIFMTNKNYSRCIYLQRLARLSTQIVYFYTNIMLYVFCEITSRKKMYINKCKYIYIDYNIIYSPRLTMFNTPHPRKILNTPLNSMQCCITWFMFTILKSTYLYQILFFFIGKYLKTSCR